MLRALTSRRWAGPVAGYGGIAVICAGLFPFRESLPTAIPALLLLVPIVVAGLAATWRTTVAVAVLAATAYAFSFLPPVGNVRFGLTTDVFMLLTFLVVALVVTGAATARRSQLTIAELDDQRMLLIRGVSHDLRNPLHAIRLASSELLADGVHDEAGRRLLLQLVAEESERVDRIVSNLLELSRMQSGELRPDRRAMAIGPLATKIAERMGPTATGGQTVYVDEGEAGAPMTVLADEVQIDQVLSNLVANALRFAPARSTITVRLRRDAETTEIAVLDEGPGFGAKAKAALFRPHRSSRDSSGLGLVLCRGIVEAHGSALHIADRPGGGTSVTFRLENALG